MIVKYDKLLGEIREGDGQVIYSLPTDSTGFGGQLLGDVLDGVRVFQNYNPNGTVNDSSELPDPTLSTGQYWFVTVTNTSWYSDGIVWSDLGLVASFALHSYEPGFIYRVNAEEQYGDVPYYYIRNATNTEWRYIDTITNPLLHELPYVLGSNNEDVVLMSGQGVVIWDDNATPTKTVSVVGDGSSDFWVYSKQGDFNNQSWSEVAIMYPFIESKYGIPFDSSATFTVNNIGSVLSPPAMAMGGSSGWGNSMRPNGDYTSLMSFTLDENTSNNVNNVFSVNQPAEAAGQAPRWSGYDWNVGGLPYVYYQYTDTMISGYSAGRVNVIDVGGISEDLVFEISNISNGVPCYIRNATGAPLQCVALSPIDSGFNNETGNVLRLGIGDWIMGIQTDDALGSYFNVVASSNQLLLSDSAVVNVQADSTGYGLVLNEPDLELIIDLPAPTVDGEAYFVEETQTVWVNVGGTFIDTLLAKLNYTQEPFNCLNYSTVKIIQGTGTTIWQPVVRLKSNDTRLFERITISCERDIRHDALMTNGFVILNYNFTWNAYHDVAERFGQNIVKDGVDYSQLIYMHFRESVIFEKDANILNGDYENWALVGGSTITLIDDNSSGSDSGFGNSPKKNIDGFFKRYTFNGATNGSMNIHYSDGYIGIGTDSPKTLLHINGDNNGIAFDAVSEPRHGLMKYANYPTMLCGQNAGVDFDISVALGRFDGLIESPNAIYTDLVVDINGNIGIGNAAPTEKLEVTGNVSLTNDNDKVILGAEKDAEILYDGTVAKINTGVVTPSDLEIDCGTEKTVKLTQSVWDDISPIPILNTRLGGANQPSLTNLVGNIQQFTFGVGDYIYGAYEIPHTYKEGTDLDIHVHWVSNGLEATEKFVKWEFEYSIANVDGTFGTATVISSENSIPANTTNRTHFYSDINGVVSGTGLLIGAYILYRFRRIASTGAAPANNPFAIALGVHIEMDTLGSRTELIK